MSIDKLQNWLYEEITERRDYTASRAFEEVLKKMQELSITCVNDKCTCQSRSEEDRCENECGAMAE